MSTSVLSAEQRQRTIGMMVALAACLVASSDTVGTIAGVSALAGTLTLALSFYALMIFCLQLTANLALVRPAVIRFWHALLLVSVTAVATWIVVLPHIALSIQRLAAFCPLCVVTALIAGAWHGLLPAFREPAAQVVGKRGKE